MGLEAMFFGRHDGREDVLRQSVQEEEWIQFPSYEDLGSDYKVFFQKLMYSYGSPDGFNFDIGAQDNLFQSDESMETFNAEEIADNMDKYL
jgi:hypothetical protein